MIKKIISRKSPENQCFADEGEELVPAPFNSKENIKLPRDEWFFKGVNTGKLSRYGWIAETDESLLDEISANQISGISVESPVACGWSEVGLGASAKKIFKIHKVFFHK